MTKCGSAVTLTGIVFALVLSIIQCGLFLGFTTTSNNFDGGTVAAGPRVDAFVETKE